MLNNVSNKTLGVIFLGLLIIFASLYFFEGDGNERSFKEDLVKIDSTSVSKILVQPKDKTKPELEFTKVENGWKVKLVSGILAPVPYNNIKGIIDQLAEMKSKRLAARSKSRWNEYQVDSSGTRVQVFEGDNKTADLIIGKFNFQQQPRSMTTFVRIANDIDVYEVDGFLDATFNREANTFRDNRITKEGYTRWRKLEYNYSDGQTYTLSKSEEGRWFLDGALTDSASTVSALQKAGNLKGTDFLDDFTPDKEPLVKLTVTNDLEDSYSVFAYQQDSTFVLNSSINETSYFDGSTNDIFSKLFFDRSKLFGEGD
ncbi:MAG: DUF4340 domain-containing protein [Melioribacteraceae bacterium]|nr:DUF4340 domain-containing protein [Melioribacteraceae bacterium]MCF8263833.1 DUF4340 domain-containing protein [Melioribacteraceae bacterium]MCF8412514.1 DUF4340 domain-containing protein [Melioribacteraceae bacterium]MCF8432179.1 DUF4340 domain-containing protein [Melioribacteraceae bacterium]